MTLDQASYNEGYLTGWPDGHKDALQRATTLEQRVAELVEKMEANPEASGMFTLWLKQMLEDYEVAGYGD
jgi:hypothetical protein